MPLGTQQRASSGHGDGNEDEVAPTQTALRAPDVLTGGVHKGGEDARQRIFAIKDNIRACHASFHSSIPLVLVL